MKVVAAGGAWLNFMEIIPIVKAYKVEGAGTISQGNPIQRIMSSKIYKGRL